jgi:hypothetical protein
VAVLAEVTWGSPRTGERIATEPQHRVGFGPGEIGEGGRPGPGECPPMSRERTTRTIDE